MVQRICLLLLWLPLGSLALVVAEPSVPDAQAQSFGPRREEGENGGRGEGRGEGRGRGRGRFGRGEEGGGRGNFGGPDMGGGRGFGRRGGGEGEREERGGRSGENSGGERPSRPSESSDSSRRERSSGGGSNIGMEAYVRSVVKEHDKDGDMMLKGDEQRGLSSKAAAADANKDGVITTDELSAALSGNAPASSSESGGENSGGSGGENGERGRRGDWRRDRDGGDGEQRRTGSGAPTITRVYTAQTAKAKPGEKPAAAGKEAEAQRTYRFKRGTDRLPASGLPSWFKSRDANGDGQVAMNEYSRSWSDRTVAEFRRYDLDGDGMVTAKEATGK